MSVGSKNLEYNIRGADSDTLKTLSDQIDIVDAFHDVATADATANAVMSDVAGNKEDAAVEAVGTTKSLVAYLKGLVQLLAQRDTPMIAVDKNTASAIAEDVVSITDKGVLTGIWGIVESTGDAATATITITIDGVALTALTVPGTETLGADEQETFSLAFNHRFDTSLRVQHQVTNNNSAVYTAVSYTKDA